MQVPSVVKLEPWKTISAPARNNTLIKLKDASGVRDSLLANTLGVKGSRRWARSPNQPRMTRTALTTIH